MATSAQMRARISKKPMPNKALVTTISGLISLVFWPVFLLNAVENVSIHPIYVLLKYIQQVNMLSITKDPEVQCAVVGAVQIF